MSIPLFKVFMSPEASVNTTTVLQSGMITQSSQVEKFENELQRYFNHPYILTLNSATSGLTLAVRLLNLKNDDKILSTALTCFATNVSILANNKSIVWVDVDEKTCNIDFDDLKLKITKETKALMFVHWGGNPLDMTRLEEIKKYTFDTFGHALHIIEDCAHSFGAKFNDQFVGTFGNIAVFSTQAIKHLTTGDGGLIFLPTKELYDRAKLLRWYGIDRTDRVEKKDFRMENDIVEWGYKFHMNDINATIGLSNLPYIETNIKHANVIADFYRQHLSKLKTIELVCVSTKARSAYWLFSIKVKSEKEEFISFLKRMGITASQVHNRNDNHSCVKEFKTNLPNLDSLEKQLVCIPIGFWISAENADYIVNVLKQWDDMHMYNLPVQMCKQYVELLSQLTDYKYSTDEKELKESYDEIHKQNSIILTVCYRDKMFASAKLLIETKFGQSVGHIEDVIVDKTVRHKQFGTKMIKELIKIAKEHKCYKVVLECKTGLDIFYKKSDFENSGISMCIRLN